MLRSTISINKQNLLLVNLVKKNAKNLGNTTLGLLKDSGLVWIKRFNEVEKKTRKSSKRRMWYFFKFYEKFIEAETARREYLEFRKYFEVLEKC